ncbi:MAG: hypothetical protein ABIH78_02845 [Candidatus Peregrinibacteria bacterium]
MTKIEKKVFLYILSLAVFVGGVLHFFPNGNHSVLETSVLGVLRNIAERNAPEPPDLSIESVSIKKQNDPTPDFDYYKYNSTIVIHNYGGELRDARVILHGGRDQKHMLIKNTSEGFSLAADKSYIIRGYDIMFDGHYNGGEIPLNLEVVDKTDYYKANNSYKLEIFEDQPLIKSISLDEVLDDGTYALNFDAAEYDSGEYKFEVLTSESATYSEKDAMYGELQTGGENRGYYLIKNSPENIKSGYKTREATAAEAHFVDKSARYVFIKATNLNTDYYAVSDVLDFSAQEKISRAQFAKIMVDYADIGIDDSGIDIFEDVPLTEWYAPYVRTLYNLGLLDMADHKYFPEKTIGRGEALKIVMDYFDADLVVSGGGTAYSDVGEDDPVFAYAEAFYKSGKGSGLGKYFSPDKPATKDFLKYLIDEYRKGN